LLHFGGLPVLAPPAKAKGELPTVATVNGLTVGQEGRKGASIDIADAAIGHANIDHAKLLRLAENIVIKTNG
jgi:hypothetical protein